MHKRKRSRHKQRKPSKSRVKHASRTEGKSWRHALGKIPGAIGWSVSAVIGFLGILSGYALLIPKVTLTPSDTLDQSAMSAPFIATNSSLFAIYDVKVSCAVANSSSPKNSYVVGIDFRNYEPKVPEMDPGEAASIHCYDIIPNVRFADVTVSATYRPSFMWFDRTQSARFVTEFMSDGQIRWIPFAKSQLQ